LCGADYDRFRRHPTLFEANVLNTPAIRIGPRHPGIAKAGYRLTRRLSEPSMARIGFHRIGSEFANQTIASIRERLQRGETVYIAGLAPSGMHNSGVALIEVTQKAGPRIIVNNEEERFSGNKHTTEYPKGSIDAMVETLRQMGRSAGDIAAFVTTWDYPVLIATMIRTVLEEAPGAFKLLTKPIAPAVDRRHIDQTRRTPRILARQLGLAERVPLICMPHHDNHAWFSFAASPFADDDEPRHRGARRHRRQGIDLALCR
jgi:carbamoyltransferase